MSEVLSEDVSKALKEYEMIFFKGNGFNLHKLAINIVSVL